MSNPIELKITARQKQHTLTIKPADQWVKLTRVLREHDLPLNTRCAGQGTCDGCLVDVADAQGDTVRIRACEHTVASLAESSITKGTATINITIPARSLLAHTPQVVSNFKLKIPWAAAPIWQGQRDGIREPLGVAIDIGTTTVAILLVNINTGKVLARGSAFNKQMRYADDVLSRINLCTTDPDMLPALQKAIVRNTLQPLINDAIAAADVPLHAIVCYTVAANTTMLHLFAGVDPTTMGVAPFTAPFLDHRVLHTADVGLEGDAAIHLLPGAAAYVGADLTAGCLVTAQAYEAGPLLLVDVGTNGEIILKHDDQLLACATAAGPAFEGARLSSGMRAADGAIQHIHFDQHLDPVLDVIAHVEPTGICGSAYLDFLAEARRHELLSPAGRFAREHPALSQSEHGKALRLADDHTHPVTITESDIASLLQAKAAIAAGIVTLLQKADLTASQVQRVYLAGGFGLHINPGSAIGSGLLPDFDPKQVEAVGNTSLAGAYLALLDSGILDETKRIAREIQVIELNLEPEFEMNYIDHLSLP